MTSSELFAAMSPALAADLGPALASIAMYVLMATVLLLASRQPDRIYEWIGALSAAMLVSGLVLVLADRIRKLLGDSVVSAIEKLMGLVLTAIAGIGVLALYSAAGGRPDPWAARHAVRYGAALCLLLAVSLVHPKVWLYLAWPIYIISILLLVAVDVVGKVGMGAQRWLILGPIQIQPSEITKVAVILVIARYYHGLSHEQAARFLYALPPLFVVTTSVVAVLAVGVLLVASRRGQSVQTAPA